MYVGGYKYTTPTLPRRIHRARTEHATRCPFVHTHRHRPTALRTLPPCRCGPLKGAQGFDEGHAASRGLVGDARLYNDSEPTASSSHFALDFRNSRTQPVLQNILSATLNPLPSSTPTPHCPHLLAAFLIASSSAALRAAIEAAAAAASRSAAFLALSFSFFWRRFSASFSRLASAAAAAAADSSSSSSPAIALSRVDKGVLL
jgi:hypothetical protein